MNLEEAKRQLIELQFKLYKCSYGDIELYNEYPKQYGYDFDKSLKLAIEALDIVNALEMNDDGLVAIDVNILIKHIDIIKKVEK